MPTKTDLVLCLITTFACLPMTAPAAHAQNEPAPRTTGEYETNRRSVLADEFVALRPHIGFMTYDNALGGRDARLTIGVTAEANVLRFYNPLGQSPDQWFLGTSIGLFVSHLGDPGADFLGFNAPAAPPNTGGNFFSVPLNIKGGYLLTNALRVGGHFGADFVYRSTEASMQLGNPAPGASANLSVYPNLGADIEYAVSRNLVFTVRPDLIFTPGADIFTGTIALVIPLTAAI